MDWKPITMIEQVVCVLYFLFPDIWNPYYNPFCVCFGYIRDNDDLPENINFPDGSVRIILLLIIIQMKSMENVRQGEA